jgi:hypothetical protein
VSKKIKSEKNLSVEEVKSAVKAALQRTLQYTVVSETADSITVKGHEKGKPVKFLATIHVSVEGNKAKLSVNGEQTAKGMFLFAMCLCIVFCWGLIPLIAFVVGLVRFFSSKNLYSTKLEAALNSVDTQLSW